jgi:hypothetical protein
MKRLMLILTLLTLLLTACARATGPKQIAMYPAEAPREPRRISPSDAVVYNAILELEVADVEDAAQRAEELAYRYGGYLSNSQTWYRDDRAYITAVLAVPVYNYAGLHGALLDLGKARGETVTGELTSYTPDGQVNYSHITLTFAPRTFAWPSLPLTGWNPGRTIESAFGVFVTIFGFIADILLWVLIVFGPFALVGWIVWVIVRRVRR